MTQLELSLAVEPCLSCHGARLVEPVYEAMEPEPCPECCDTAWFVWLRNPYGLLAPDRCPRCRARVGYDPSCAWCSRCRLRSYAAHFRRPERAGQLGLGL